MALAYVLSAMLSPFQTSAGPMLICTAVVCGIARTPRPMACVLLGSVIVLGAFTLTLVAGLGLSGFEAARFAGSTMLQEWGGYPELGLLGLLVLPPVVSLGLHSRRLSASLAIVVLGSAIAAGLFFTFSRAAWVVAAVTTGLVVVVWQRRTALVAAVGAAVLAAMLLWAMFLPSTPATSTGAMAVSARTAAWSAAADLWRQRWLTGWGPGTYGRAFRQQHPASMADARFHAHNTPLHVAAETGILGVVTFLYFASRIFAAACRRVRGLPTLLRALRLGLLASLTGAGLRLLADYFDPGAAPERVMITLAVVAGLAVALSPDPLALTPDGQSSFVPVDSFVPVRRDGRKRLAVGRGRLQTTGDLPRIGPDRRHAGLPVTAGAVVAKGLVLPPVVDPSQAPRDGPGSNRSVAQRWVAAALALFVGLLLAPGGHASVFVGTPLSGACPLAARRHAGGGHVRGAVQAAAPGVLDRPGGARCAPGGQARRRPRQRAGRLARRVTS